MAIPKVVYPGDAVCKIRVDAFREVAGKRISSILLQRLEVGLLPFHQLFNVYSWPTWEGESAGANVGELATRL